MHRLQPRTLPDDRHLIRKHHLRDRDLVFVGVCPKLLHRREGILGRVLLRRHITFPFDESAADGVVLLLEQNLVAGQELGGHRVLVMKVALGRIVNDVLKAHVDRLGTKLDGKSLVRLVLKSVEK